MEATRSNSAHPAGPGPEHARTMRSDLLVHAAIGACRSSSTASWGAFSGPVALADLGR
jgi:hypothetical protein